MLLLLEGATALPSSSPPKTPTYKLPRQPVQRVKSLPVTDPLTPIEPYLYSIGDPRIDLYLPTNALAVTEAVRQIEPGPEPVEHIVEFVRRLPGTRAPLHTHDYGVMTCVIKGQMTIFTNDTAQVTYNRDGVCFFALLFERACVCE